MTISARTVNAIHQLKDSLAKYILKQSTSKWLIIWEMLWYYVPPEIGIFQPPTVSDTRSTEKKNGMMFLPSNEFKEFYQIIYKVLEVQMEYKSNKRKYSEFKKRFFAFCIGNYLRTIENPVDVLKPKQIIEKLPNPIYESYLADLVIEFEESWKKQYLASKSNSEVIKVDLIADDEDLSSKINKGMSNTVVQEGDLRGITTSALPTNEEAKGSQEISKVNLLDKCYTITLDDCLLPEYFPFSDLLPPSTPDVFSSLCTLQLETMVSLTKPQLARRSSIHATV